MALSLQEVYPRPAPPQGRETAIHGPVSLFDAVIAMGRKSVTLQRYKGLGEMNPGQLWETALDTNARSLMQVKVKGVDEADDIFTKLMGDVVEPRRGSSGQRADGERGRVGGVAIAVTAQLMI